MDLVREEQLREAACVGDLEALGTLVRHNVDVNSKNAVNGWTALHWGCKRGRLEAVRTLLAAGADVTATNSAGETPAELTRNRHILQLLGVEVPAEQDSPEQPSVPAPDLGFTPSYMAYPPLQVDLSPSRLPNGYADDTGEASSEAAPATAGSLPPSNGQTVLPNGKVAAPAPPNGDAVTPASCSDQMAAPAMAVNSRQPALSPALVCCCQRKPAKGAVPDNVLVLKVRIAGNGDDFIELELPTDDLSYYRLLRESCRELGLDRQAVERVRKLPNTLVRSDAEVRRMADYQELELVVRGGVRPETAGGRQPAPFSAPIVY